MKDRRLEQVWEGGNLALESLPVAIFWITPDGYIHSVTQRARVLMSQTDADLSKIRLDEFVRFESKQDYHTFFKMILEGKEPESCHVAWNLIGGQVVSLLLRGNISIENGLVQIVACEITGEGPDTAFKTNYELLKDVAKIGQWEVDHRDGSLFWCRKTYEIFEIDPNEIHLDLDFFTTRVHPDDRDMVMQTYLVSRQNQTPYELDHRILVGEKKIKWVRETCQWSYDENGNSIRSLGTCQDITSQKQLESQLQSTEANYYLLVENTSTLVWSCDLEYRFTYLNPAWEKILGYTREEMMDRSHSDFKPSEVLVRDQEAIEKFSRDKVVVSDAYETIFLTKQGQRRYIEFHTTPIFDAGGEIIGTHGTALDITDRRLAEIKLEESFFELEQVQSAIDQHAIVAMTDLSGKIIYANQRFCEISQYSRHDLLGNNHRIINSGHHGPEFFKSMYQTIKNGNTWHGEIKNRAKDGTHYWVSTTISPLKNAQGEIDRYLAIRTDITAIKEAEEKIQKLLSEKEIILIEVHHRIKNNMNTIYSLLRLEATLQADSTQETILVDASNRVKSMLLLYDKLYRSERTDKLLISVYFPALIAEILKIFPSKIKIETMVEVDSLLLDPTKISSLGIILNELITNSMKYSFEGRRSGKISFSAKEKEGYLHIEYSDDGISMDPNVDLEHSVGFGLNLISMMIRQLKGKVTLNRISGNQFYIEVPI
ncbi:PAS domain S-box protein [Leptospira ognonensis]|uniref:histidine kinase n=1 Tax=Leptospira ognonensis TaxID=2484945 RepID=A0A4R9JVS3_9LEPT|nr:PAS domain S-box protein [Leptospira ognonensis]TGL56421.1 PAS domain S-box protein [Leptospira ognonensis]